jgi:hypothetical protein
MATSDLTPSPRKGTQSTPIQPRWVSVEGELYLVSEFALLSSHRRPPALCPLCLLPVVLKLGQIKVHHYAHAREAECAASQPETALHLNTKFHFYRQLKEAQERELWLEEVCRRCKEAKRRHLWARDWDEVGIEYRMESARPDIALLLGSQVMGALEILVTHAVDERKASYLGEQGVPWLEIPATPELYLEPTAWKVKAPLPVVQLPFPAWTCPGCVRELEQERLEKEEHAAQRKDERERAAKEKKWAEENRFYVETHAAMMVDFYFPGEKKYRDIFYVNKGLRGGVWIEAWVADRKKRRLHQVKSSSDGPLDNRALQQLKRFIDRYLAQKRGQGIVIVDIVAPWRLWRPGQKFVARAFDRYPYLNDWDDAEGEWVLQGEAIEEDMDANRDAVSAIIQAIRSNTDDQSRAALVACLSEFTQAQVGPALRAFLQDSSVGVREAAAEVLAKWLSKGE